MKYKAIFVSDVHIGMRISKAGRLVQFLKENDFQQLYLVGDIVEMVGLKKLFYWESDFNKLIQRILKVSRKGARVTYIVGNHDHYMDEYCGYDFAGVEIRGRVVHESADGKKYLVIHGHQYDGFVREMPWLYWLGDQAYSVALMLNPIHNFINRTLGKESWSLSMWLKGQVKSSVKFINNFEKVVAREARAMDLDGVISGHIHVAEDKLLEEIRYLNCGCWTEYCSAIVEHEDGRFEMLMVE
ncbi:MAG: hypothetical protein A2X49_15070 [Lentisphaerae bacterium GWF2_52_8]|nr:MAG: hypothetical protein A2X49_15070 [Lentisphaerae bacterium GWF2_52_8]